MTDQNIFTFDHLRQIERIKDNAIGVYDAESGNGSKKV
jgi:hypothetical protein